MPFQFKWNKKKKQKTVVESIQKEAEKLKNSLVENIEIIKEETGNSPDVIIRSLQIGHVEIAAVYVDGITDKDTINDFIIDSIIKKEEEPTEQEVMGWLEKSVVAVGAIQRIKNFDSLFLSLMNGETLILIDQLPQALTVETIGGEKRAIDEPSTQVTTRGPRDSFTESIQTNVSLVRRRIKNPYLWAESYKIGRQTKTDVAIMYLNGVVNEKIVEEVRSRIERIDIDSILDAGYIEEFIQDDTTTVFPTVYNTERPDTVAAEVLEGKIAIFVDNSPNVLLAPAIFVGFFQTAEDYYVRSDMATALRLLRFFTFFVSLLAPSIYVAATTFHPEMLPPQLVVIIAAQREAVPFPALVEALLMEATFEILREAGLRMPRAVGNAFSVVGALVIGQAAIQAGIVSPAMVIIVAITAITSFTTPTISMAAPIRIIRFGFMFAAGIFGLYGIMIAFIYLVLHLCSLRSFGVSYMSPLAPVSASNLKDTLVRMPWWSIKDRPKHATDNITRGGENLKPNAPGKRTMSNQYARKKDQSDDS